MRIAHLSRARGAADGGISQVVENLLTAQSRHWMTSSSVMAPSGSVGWFTPPANLRRELGVFQPQLLHVHGLWSSSNRLLAWHSQQPTVIAPHGMLDPWALSRSRRRKSLAWLLYEKSNLLRAGAIQALCPAEAEAIRALLPCAPIAVIPNGVQLPADVDPSLPAPPWAGMIPNGAPVLLFFGRFHAKKGLDPLLQAWQAVAAAAERSGWWLALVGYGDDGALNRRVSDAQASGALPQVFVGGPAFAAEKAAVLHGASAFVLPSLSEGLPMAALEAMAHQLPCLLSPACNLPEAFRLGAALPAPAEREVLAASLQQLFALSAVERAAMGRAGRALVAEHYSWPRVAEQTRRLYQWILGGGERPDFVELG